MNINGEELKTIDVFPSMMTVPDCMVVASNKLGSGHGEAKLYVGPKENMREFYGGEAFKAKCFLLKKDLITYMETIKNEYMTPSQNYAQKEKLPSLWKSRMDYVMGLDDVILFEVEDQKQITGDRGYINSNDNGYQLIRNLALPLVSYIYAEKVGKDAAPLYYWKLFVDFDAMEQKQVTPLVFRYRHGEEQADDPEIEQQEKAADNRRQQAISNARIGQGKYREKLLEQCPFCPITMIADERLLVASHIKPWAVSEDDEKIDPYNGYMLSPMIDKLFDKGFVTFTNSKHMLLSEFISPATWKKIGLENNRYYQGLVMDNKREKYLDFHRNSVFKGTACEE